MLDPATGAYNAPFLPAGVRLATGYGRMQGVVFRPGDPRFGTGTAVKRRPRGALDDGACFVVNRNRGSGTRVLIDRLLDGRKPPGHGRRGAVRTTRSPPRSRRGGPTGAWRSPRSRSRTAWGSSRWSKSATTSRSPKPAGTAPPSPAFREILGLVAVRERLEILMGERNLTTENTGITEKNCENKNI